MGLVQGTRRLGPWSQAHGHIDVSDFTNLRDASCRSANMVLGQHRWLYGPKEMGGMAQWCAQGCTGLAAGAVWPSPPALPRVPALRPHLPLQVGLE